VFQFHHQPLNYYASFAPGTAGRDHLKDEVEFQQLVAASDKKCQLNSVSFIKPIGLENEHPGYTNVDRGSSHLVKLIKSIEASSCEKNTMIIVTYDEFGGQWDHVSPPGQGGAPGVHDIWGPGTRIPALVLAKDLKGKFVVDSTQYDTTSIDATIEQRYGLAPLSSRDEAVNSLSNVFGAKKAKDDG
jgi:phospholipase C